MASEVIKKSDDSTQLPELPWEIIVYIVEKLPVKTLVRSKCVSKAWRFLISSPDFVKKHLRMSTEDESCTSVLVSTTSPNHGFKACSFTFVHNDPFLDVIELDYPFDNTELDYSTGYPYPRSYPRLIGYCNGLLCIAYSRDTVYLWNPCIREFKRLPHMFEVESRSEYSIEFGFGYDHSTNDYKIAAISYLYCRGEVKICSLRANRCKKIQDFHYGLHKEPGKFVSGALIWSATRVTMSTDGTVLFSWLIIALDLETETFRELPQPVYDTGHDRLLGVFQGCVGVLANYNYKAHADLWVMKEYGVPESWTRLLKIPYLQQNIEDIFEHNFKSLCLCLLKNGEILRVFKSQLILYDPKHNTIRSPMTHHFSGSIKADIYIESLVSPNAVTG